jgi:hypothetical protein
MSITQIKSRVTYTHTYRFTTTVGASAETITGKSLCAINGLVVTVANTTASLITSSAKLISVSMYGAAPADAGLNTMSVSFTSLDGSPSINEFTRTSVTPAIPLRLLAKPPRGTLASNHISATDDTILCYLNCAANTIVDIVAEFSLKDGETNAVDVGIAAGSLGEFYYGRLTDDVASIFQNLSLPSKSWT